MKLNIAMEKSSLIAESIDFEICIMIKLHIRIFISKKILISKSFVHNKINTLKWWSKILQV
jgi:hypothetical protein